VWPKAVPLSDFNFVCDRSTATSTDQVPTATEEISIRQLPVGGLPGTWMTKRRGE
jgi:hypothetical protein